MSVKASEISFNEGVLRLAVVHKKVVRFRYAKSDSAPIESREFAPSMITLSAAGDMSFTGYDEDRAGVRRFRVDRIKGEVEFA